MFLLYTIYNIFMNIKNILTGFFSWSPLQICLDVNLVSVALKLVHWPRVNRSSCGEEVETSWTLKSLHDLIDLTTDGSPSVSLQQAEWFVLWWFLFNCCQSCLKECLILLKDICSYQKALHCYFYYVIRFLSELQTGLFIELTKKEKHVLR